jgi:hypothetical protein
MVHRIKEILAKHKYSWAQMARDAGYGKGARNLLYRQLVGALPMDDQTSSRLAGCLGPPPHYMTWKEWNRHVMDERDRADQLADIRMQVRILASGIYDMNNTANFAVNGLIRKAGNGFTGWFIAGGWMFLVLLSMIAGLVAGMVVRR